MAVVELDSDTELDQPKVKKLGAFEKLDPPRVAPSRMERAGAAVGDFLRGNPKTADVIGQGGAGVVDAGAFVANPIPNLVNAYGSAVDWLGRNVANAMGVRSLPQGPLAETTPIPPGAIFGQGDRMRGDVQDVHALIGKMTGAPIPPPSTTAGRYARAATGGAVVGGIPGLIGGALSQVPADIPGIAGTELEGPASLALGMGGAYAANRLAPTRNAATMVANRMEGTTADDLAVARARQAEGQRIGVPLSPVEALDNRALQGLASDVTASPTGGPAMNRMFDQRAATLPGVLRTRIAPEIASAPDYMRGIPLRDAPGALTAEAKRAGYTAANSQNIPAPVMEGYLQRLDAALANPQLPKSFEAALRDLRDKLTQQPAVPARPAVPYNSGGFGIPATPAQPAVPGKPRVPVTNINAIAQERLLGKEMMDLPAMSADNINTKLARVNMMSSLDDLNDVLKTNPSFAAGSAAYEKGAPSAQLLTQIDDALEKVRATQGGPNRMVGVSVRNQMLGNDPGTLLATETQTAIREAATRQGRNPDAALAGAMKVFDVLERTGRIPGVGSQTGGRMQAAQEASNPGFVGKAIEAGNVPRGTVFSTAQRALQNYYYRDAYRELGRLFTNPTPEAIDMLARMGRMDGPNIQLMLPALIATAPKQEP